MDIRIQFLIVIVIVGIALWIINWIDHQPMVKINDLVATIFANLVMTVVLLFPLLAFSVLNIDRLLAGGIYIFCNFFVYFCMVVFFCGLLAIKIPCDRWINRNSKYISKPFGFLEAIGDILLEIDKEKK